MAHTARARRKANILRRAEAARKQEPLSIDEQLRRREENATNRRDREWARLMRVAADKCRITESPVKVSEHPSYPDARTHTFLPEGLGDFLSKANLDTIEPVAA